MKLMRILLFVVIAILLIALLLGGLILVGRKSAESEIKEYFIEEEYSGISIDTTAADITVLPSDDGITKVITSDTKKMTHTVSVENGTLRVDLKDERGFFDRIISLFENLKITVYLPTGEYGALTIKSDTGRVKIAKEFCFESIYVSESTGEVSCYASSEGSIRIKTSTGKIVIKDAITASLDLSLSTGDVEVANVACQGDVKISISTGKTSITALECRNLTSIGSTGSMHLNSVLASEKIDIERSTGDVIFGGTDASEIKVLTDTGDIRGTLLSEKIFYAESDTGRVNVPKSTSGGMCELITDTGNITISIAE